MRSIRASEIGTYIYCQRAWWYLKRGYKSENQVELATGSEIHAQHGRQVCKTGVLRGLAILLSLLAIGLFTAYLTQLWV